MGYEGESPIEPATMRGRNWPCLRQFGVFLENKVGRLHELLRQLERDDVRVVALSINDSVDYAIARLIVNNYERGLELLNFSNFPFFENDVIGVVLPDIDQPHVSICAALMSAEVNVHYTYPLMYRRHGRGAIALYAEDTDEGLRVLKEQGHTIITENELLEDDEYFGG